MKKKNLVIFVVVTILALITFSLLKTVSADDGKNFGEAVIFNNETYRYIGSDNGLEYFMKGTQINPYYYNLAFFNRPLDDEKVMSPINHRTVYALGMYDAPETTYGFDQHLVNVTMGNKSIYFYATEEINTCVKVYRMETDGTVSNPLTGCLDPTPHTGGLHAISDTVFRFEEERKSGINRIYYLNENGAFDLIYETSNSIGSEYFYYDAVGPDIHGIYFREYNVGKNIDKIMYIDKAGNTTTVKEYPVYNYMIIFFEKNNVFFAVSINKNNTELAISKLTPNSVEELHTTSKVEDPRDKFEFEYEKIQYHGQTIYEFEREL